MNFENVSLIMASNSTSCTCQQTFAVNCSSHQTICSKDDLRDKLTGLFRQIPQTPNIDYLMNNQYADIETSRIINNFNMFGYNHRILDSVRSENNSEFVVLVTKSRLNDYIFIFASIIAIAIYELNQNFNMISKEEWQKKIYGYMSGENQSIPQDLKNILLKFSGHFCIIGARDEYRVHQKITQNVSVNVTLEIQDHINTYLRIID